MIVEAQQATKAREVAIDQAKADRLVALTEADAELEVAKKQQMVDLLHADTQRQVGLKLTAGVNQAFVQQRVLTVLESLAKSKNRIFVVPDEALTNPAMMTSVNQKALENDAVSPAPKQPASK